MIEGILFGLGWIAASMFFYPVLIVAFLLLWALSENDKLGWATLATIIVGALAVTRWPGLIEFFSHPLNIALVLGGYTVVGIAWSFGKWYLRNTKLRNKFLDIKNDFVSDNKIASNYFSQPKDKRDEKIDEAFVAKLALQYGPVHRTHTVEEAMERIIPKAEQNKKSIMMWGVYWPLSALWFFLNDFVTELANWVYDRLGKTYQRISNAMFADVLQ